MPSNQSPSLRGARVLRQASAVLATLTLSIAAAYAAPVFDKPAADFGGRVFSLGALPGSEATIAGRMFVPGQKVMLYRAGEALNNGEAITVGEKGTFEAKVAIPADAVPGLHPIAITAANPAAAAVFDLKVVGKVPLSGQDNYTVTSQKLVQGLYQAAYSPKSDRIFVTAAVGRPPVKDSQLLKLNPATLATEAKVAMARVPQREDGQVFAAYGVGVDDTHGNVWVTNTRENTVAVYKQSSLALVKQFPAGDAYHARDVVVDEKLNKAYVSSPGKGQVVVFDTKKLALSRTVPIDSGQEKGFSTMSIALDDVGHKLYVVSGATPQAAVIDTRSDKVERVLDIPNLKGGAGIAVDPKGNRLFAVAQGSDNLVIVDLKTGKVLHDVQVGQGALNVAFDAKRGHAVVVSRGAGTVTIVDGDGKIVANLPAGTFPNHVALDGRGDVLVINKSKSADDPEGDRISRIVPKR